MKVKHLTCRERECEREKDTHRHTQNFLSRTRPTLRREAKFRIYVRHEPFREKERHKILQVKHSPYKGIDVHKNIANKTPTIQKEKERERTNKYCK